jgi:IS30 family transposase
VRKIVAGKLILDWSPEQVSEWLKIHYPDDESLRVSHETIYRSLFSSARSAEKRAAWAPAIQASHTPLAALSYLSLETRAVKSQMPSPSGKGPLELRTAPCRVIGRAIS